MKLNKEQINIFNSTLDNYLRFENDMIGYKDRLSTFSITQFVQKINLDDFMQSDFFEYLLLDQKEFNKLVELVEILSNDSYEELDEDQALFIILEAKKSYFKYFNDHILKIL